MPQSLDAPLAKQFKTHGEQIALLRERGMLIESDSEACRLLEQVNYYRLSGYWYSWRKLLEPEKRADSFVEGTTLDDVAAVYMFDCKLREIVFACLAPIELSVRSMLGHELGSPKKREWRFKIYTPISPVNMVTQRYLCGLAPRLVTCRCRVGEPQSTAEFSMISCVNESPKTSWNRPIGLSMVKG